APVTETITWSALRRVRRPGCMVKFPPSKNRAHGAAENPLLFSFRQLVGVAEIEQRLSPRVVGLALRVVAGPHDALSAKSIDGTPQIRQHVSKRIRLPGEL